MGWAMAQSVLCHVGGDNLQKLNRGAWKTKTSLSLGMDAK